MNVISLTFNEFQENTYILYDETSECVIIDPGCSNAREEKILSETIEKHQLRPVRLINTHCHIDHIYGNQYIAEKYDLPLESHRGEIPVLEAAPQIAMMYGLKANPSPPITKFLDEGDQLTFGNTTLDVLFTPGHSPASISFYNAADKILISGDVLFQGSIGRTDLPGGNYDLLINNIKTKLLTLPDDVVVYSGHGPSTSIGFERKNNPFLQQ
ncbi:MAG: MBL fold metallo-hydrolase [Bacteroidia bacterium]|nr:MBL fold metallo-hydrolase [Bacteroidia bacterium]